VDFIKAATEGIRRLAVGEERADEQQRGVAARGAGVGRGAATRAIDEKLDLAGAGIVRGAEVMQPLASLAEVTLRPDLPS